MIRLLLLAFSVAVALALVLLGWPPVHAALLGFMGGQVGPAGLVHGVGHSLFSRQAAANIGWESNGFQKEVGAANIAYGVSGLLSLSLGLQFCAATLVVFTIFYFGAGMTHIWDMQRTGNHAPGNGWPHVLLVCFLTPALGWVLFGSVAIFR